MKTTFKPKRDYLLLRAVARQTTNGGVSVTFNPRGQTVDDRWGMLEKLEVDSVGDEVKDFKKGDKVFVRGHVFNQVCIPRHIGKELKKDNFGSKSEEYYWSKEEDVVGKTINIIK